MTTIVTPRSGIHSRAALRPGAPPAIPITPRNSSPAGPSSPCSRAIVYLRRSRAVE
jgi:hypothetical protein